MDFQFPNPSGTTSAGFSIVANEITPGTLIVSGVGTTPMSGSGMMVKLNFIPIGTVGTSSQLSLSNVQLNEGTPCSTTQNGQANVSGGSIAGTIRYGTAATLTPVENVTVTAAGTSNSIYNTGANGTYLLSGLGLGAYTVTPTKSSDINGISALDASFVVQHIVGMTTLSANQQIAADASGNSTISSFDASLIARFAIGSPSTQLAGTWKFLPASRTYASVLSDLIGEDYTAILIGEVTGNWAPPSSQITNDTLDERSFTSFSEFSRLSVSLPKASAKRNTTATVPITLTNFGVQSIKAYQFDLTYDPLVIQPADVPFDKAQTLSGDFSIEVNVVEYGRLRVAVFGANSLTGSGVLLNLKFRVVGPVNSQSGLIWQNFQFNEGDPGVRPANGRFKVAR